MRIGRLELYYVVFPLIYPWTTAYGADSDVHTILVKLASGDHEGWGETTPLYAPCYSPESSVGVYHTIREYFAPQIVGQDFQTARHIRKRLKHFKGNYFRQGGNRERLVASQGQYGGKTSPPAPGWNPQGGGIRYRSRNQRKFGHAHGGDSERNR